MKLENGQEWRDGKLYGWTGQFCHVCRGHGVDDDNRTCRECGGTGDEWGLMPAQPAATPYPWCRTPHICTVKGYCPRDPNCGE